MLATGVPKDEERGGRGDDGGGGEEDKRIAQLIKSSLAAELDSLLLVVSFDTLNTVIY